MKSRSGKVLRDPQPRSIDGILRVWEHGALVGEGTARGALLADSMGLGKTASAIIAASRARLHRVLVVAPKSALGDWRREIDDWHPRPGTVRTIRSGRPWLDFDTGWALMNYELLERRAEEVRRRGWDLLVLDEGHATKEPERRCTILIHGGVWRGKEYSSIPARKALVVSGTPMKNRVEELFTTLSFLNRATFTDRDEFIDAHYEPLTENGQSRIVTEDGRVVQNVATRNLEDLHRRLRETVLVRTHKDDVAGLPGRRFEKVEVPLDEAADRDWFDEKADAARKMSRLLRKVQRAREWDLARELEEQLRKLRSAIYQHAARAKRQTVLDYLLALPPGHKVVVIGFHRDLLLDQLAAALRRRGRRLVEHNGDNSARAAATVRAFQTRPDVQFFIGQLTVSSLSLTLTAAHHVVFAEIPQTRADLDQAFDRVHRLGQERECVATVFSLAWPTSGDEDLLEALLRWRDASSRVLDGREGESMWDWQAPIRHDRKLAA